LRIVFPEKSLLALRSNAALRVRIKHWMKSAEKTFDRNLRGTATKISARFCATIQS
jgi:hypothetical protein